MKRTAAFLLLIVLSATCPLPAQTENKAATAENMRRARKESRQHQKALDKLSKKQRKAIKKYGKAQRKAQKKARHRGGI